MQDQSTTALYAFPFVALGLMLAAQVYPNAAVLIGFVLASWYAVRREER